MPTQRTTFRMLVTALVAVTLQPVTLFAADRLIGLHSAQVMSQSMPWIAREAGLFKKYDIDFNLVFIPSSPVATAATLSGDAEIGVTGAVGNVRAIVQGSTDLVFIGGMPTAEFGMSIYTSIQKVGLKLEPQKFPLDTIVVDRGEKTPIEN